MRFAVFRSSLQPVDIDGGEPIRGSADIPGVAVEIASLEALMALAKQLGEPLIMFPVGLNTGGPEIEILDVDER